MSNSGNLARLLKLGEKLMEEQKQKERLQSAPLRGGLGSNAEPVKIENRQERRKQKKFDRIKQKQLRKGIK